MQYVCLVSSILGTLLYSIVGYFGYKGIGKDLGCRSILSLFTETDTDLLKELVSRKYLGFVPTFTNCIFTPIFYSGIVFNTFPIIRLVSNIISSFTNKEVRREKIALGMSGFIFLFGIYKIDIDSLTGLLGYLLTAPLSFTFPAYFVSSCIKKMNAMKCGALIMQFVSISLVVILTSVEIKNSFSS